MIKPRNEKDWEEKLYTKSTLKWYRLAKDDIGVERYMGWIQGQKSVRLLFRLRTGSGGLLEKNRDVECLETRGV